MAGTDNGDLQAVCEEFLDVCYAALASTPGGQPSCVFVSPGPPSWDTCPMLAVHTSGPAVGDTFPLQPTLAPAHRTTVQGQVNLVAITATVLRCSPGITDVGSLPSPAEMTLAASATNADLWSIWNHIRAAKRTGTLFAPKERELFMDPAVALNQQGGCCGWQITVRTELDGYKPA